MRDRWGYARTLTAGLSLALALSASGCLVAEGAEDEAPELAHEITAVTVQAAPSEAKAPPVVELRVLADEEEAQLHAISPGGSELDDKDKDKDKEAAAHGKTEQQTPSDEIFLDPPPQPWTPPRR
jgi:hypothetical protein